MNSKKNAQAATPKRIPTPLEVKEMIERVRAREKSSR